MKFILSVKPTMIQTLQLHCMSPRSHFSPINYQLMVQNKIHPFIPSPIVTAGGRLLMDFGRESILKVGREQRAEEREGQKGHHGSLWWDGWRRGRGKRGGRGGGNKLCYR